MSDQKHHFEPLTWLRGIAAFLVVISHTLRATQDTYLDNDEPVNWLMLRIFDLGTFGVLLFFTLSGTTLYLSHSKQQKNLSIVPFYIKRFLRIWPAFALSLFVYFIFSFVFRNFYGKASGNWIEQQFLQLPSAADFVSYLTLSFNIFGQKGLFNNAYWSLPVEFQYYLLFPVIILLLPRLKILSPVIIGLALYLAFKLDLGLFNDRRVLMLGFTFCGGVLLGYVYKQYELHVNSCLGTFLLLFFFASASAMTNQFIDIPKVPVISNQWIMLGLIALSVVACILFSEIKLPKFFTHQFFKLGELSYSLYLYHNLFIGFAVLILIQFNVTNGALRYLLVLMLGGGVSLFVAYWSYLHVELPFMRVGSRLSRM